MSTVIVCIKSHVSLKQLSKCLHKKLHLQLFSLYVRLGIVGELTPQEILANVMVLSSHEAV